MIRALRSILLLVLLAGIGTSHAEPAPLGRLFLDPQQRARLDQQRQRNGGYQANASEGALTINGEVRASNGRRTRWINGEPNWEGERKAPDVPIGDTINPATGQRDSVIGDGHISVRRAPPRP